ncbi:Canalicular multispecific organic anion transporter 2, partial [Mortierella sp. GBA43]
MGAYCTDQEGWVYLQTCPELSTTLCMYADQARIVQLTRDKDNSSPSDLLATSTLLVAWTSAIGLNYFENRVDIRSSSFIFAFYVVCIAASAIVIHTMHDLTLAGQSHFASFCVFFGAIVCGFVVEAWPRTSPLAPPSLSSQSDKKGFADNNRDNSTAYDRSNLFSRLSFHYIQPVMSLGFRRPLGNEDIANMMPRQTRTANAYQNLSRAWNHHLQKRKSSKREPSLIWVVLKAGGWAWVPIIAYSILESALDFIQPILLDNILDVIASNSTDEPKPTSLGVILAVGMFLAAVLATFSNCQYFQLGTNLGNEIKTGLISMIYQKALRLSPEARREATIGEITNHMSVDAERTCETLQYLVLLLSIVLEIIVGTWLLCRQLGPSALTGFGVVLLSVPLQTAIAKVLNKAKDMKLEFMDKRIRLLSDVLSGIRAVKLYSWERSFQEQLDEIRQNELKQLRR